MVLVLGCDQKLFHGDRAFHVRPVKLSRTGYFDNWDWEKRKNSFFCDFRLPSKISMGFSPRTPLRPEYEQQFFDNVSL